MVLSFLSWLLIVNLRGQGRVIAMNHTRMSPGSAIAIVAAWITSTGRAPSRQECCKANGLPHAQTLQYVCGGLTRAIELAEAYLQVGSAALSAYACNARTVACLRCGRAIVWEGAHVRQCSLCRKAGSQDEVLYYEPPTRAWVHQQRYFDDELART